MGRDQMYFPMEMCFWENITMARLKDMVSIAGLTETFIVACLSTVANKGRVLGRNLVQKNTNVYEGEYHDDIKHGYGEFKWATGGHYRG